MKARSNEKIISTSLNNLCDNYSLSSLPTSVIDKAGKFIDISGMHWRVSETSKNLLLKWDLYTINNLIIEYAFKRYLIQKIKKYSPGTVHTTFHRIVVKLTKFPAWKMLEQVTSIKDTEKVLPRVLSYYLQELRKNNKEYNFICIRSWYKWCVDQELPGFSAEVMYTLSRIKMSGNPQGIAVLSEDLEEGPLTNIEVVLLRNALINDCGPLIERLCLWLSLSYGCNPANFVLLRESDFTVHKFESIDEYFYELKLPRIKKRGQHHKRADFKVRKVDERLAKLITQQIEENKKLGLGIGIQRPLLMRKTPFTDWLATELSEFAYHISTSQFLYNLKKCVKRLKIISPRTGKELYITPRRLRYTYATSMVTQGASAAELADLLDHSDMQHVRIYYNARSNIIERLDAALAEKLAPLVNAFKGKIISQEERADRTQIESTNIRYQENRNIRKIHGIGTCGATYLCKLYPPLSCYLCEKFQAW